MHLHNLLFLSSSADFVFKITLRKNLQQRDIRMTNLFDPNQDQCSEIPDLGQNVLKRPATDNKLELLFYKKAEISPFKE